MSLAPLLAASPVIQFHVLVAFLAFFLGALVLFHRKGDRPHKRLGRIWVGLMAMVALSSFFIWELRVFGLFSPIHLLSLGTLVFLWLGIRAARRHNIVVHKAVMRGIYVGALLVTGFFTFLPGRIMYRVVFGEDGPGVVESGVFVTLVLLVVAAAVALLRRPAAA